MAEANVKSDIVLIQQMKISATATTMADSVVRGKLSLVGDGPEWEI